MECVNADHMLLNYKLNWELFYSSGKKKKKKKKSLQYACFAVLQY